MRYSLVLIIGLAAATALPVQTASAQQAKVYALGCSLTDASQTTPILTLGNTGGATLNAGQIVDVDFSSGIKFAVTLPQDLPTGFAVRTELPDTVGSVPQGTCTARLGS